MKICYPFRDTTGQDFRSQDEVMRLIDGEAHGSWLLGANGLWHGGIHISDISNPFSALNPEAVNSGDPVPLQFMADGAIVAYRLNRDSMTAPYCGLQLRYSSSFVLVKSLCKPEAEKQETWLEFYSLYMHLAPVADYPVSPCYKVRTGHSGILLRKYTKGQNGLSEGEEEHGEYARYAAPGKSSKSLNAGDRFVTSRTGRFYVTKNGQTSLVTFGLVRLLNGKQPGDKQYWVTLDPELTEQDGEMKSLMPAWMSRAGERGEFDVVVLPDDTDEWKVSAGAAVGFMGCTESPGTRGGLVDKDWFVHLEVLSTDPKMPVFLSNPAGVKGDKRSIRALKGKPLYIRQQTDPEEFVPISATLGAQCFLSRDAATPAQDASKKWWYKVSGSGWLPEDAVEEVGQYDLLKQGFQTLEESSSGDMMDSPFEGWVPEAFGSISRAAEQGNYQYNLVPKFYRDLITEMDSNRDGKVTAEEIRQALGVRDPVVRDVVNRLVIKHHSEWSGGRSTGRWEGFYKDLDTLEVKYCEKWQADLEWMSQVPAFNKDEAVWHFHPVAFLGALGEASELINVDAFIALYEQEHTSFAPGTPALSLVSKNNLREIVESINEFYPNHLEYKPNLYRVSYMLATARHETYNYPTAEYFSEQPEVGGMTYFNKYDPVLASTQALKNRAIANGNTQQGDGYKYRGRGCVHLTWKNNYQKAKDKFGTNYVDQPDLAADFKSAVPIMVWGMEEGIFTGKNLSSYIGSGGVDYEGARKIINSSDQKILIASYAKKFQSILESTSSLSKEF
ncbi:hypothetical protein [Buttiauxella massiliensis]|uniref:hypothetical protein n=1 Tax=Buttiauxella massiliensis TaxID=2831590 RepID=UPI00125F5A65|nr:hypothetical protein [Buttiauxella massiliensis]